MDLSHPAYDLFGRSTAQVLQSLSRVSDGLTGRRLSQLSEVSLSSTQRILAHLEHVGLVDVRPVGRALLYSANRSHVLWAVVESAFTAPLHIAGLASEIAQNHAGMEVIVAFYGSFARGDAGPESDLDVLVVWLSEHSEDKQAALLDELDVRLSRATGNRVEILDLPLCDLHAMVAARDPLVESWRREAKTVSGGIDLLTLLKPAAA